MTDPAVAPLAPPPATDAEPWQVRLEALAALLVLSAVVVIISAFATARAQLGQFETFGPGASPPRSGFSEVGGSPARRSTCSSPARCWSPSCW